jgi:Domain of unknown function (DUF4377)
MRVTIAAVAVSVFALAACTYDDGPVELTVDINSNMSPCLGPGDVETLCLEYRYAAGAQWRAEYTPIEGFKYEWGKTYVLRILETILNEPGGKWPVARKLIEVKSESEVPRTSTFRMRLQSPQKRLVNTGDVTWRLFGQEALVCDPSLCAAVAAKVSAELPMILTFDHLNSPAGPLHLVAIE